MRLTSLAGGTQLSHFEIIELLGSGGMGEVYRAEDLRLGREVAIKVLQARHSDKAEYRARFEREARAVAALSHPNIVHLHDIGTHEGNYFAVSELLEGETLRQRLDREQLPLSEQLRIGREVAEGLAAAHRGGVVHRDLKPANIFLTDDGRVKILDFGLAAFRQPLSGDSSGSVLPKIDSEAMTQAGEIIGTVGYLSPEQAHGHEIDSRSDIFALGAVLFEMVTRQRAFPGSTPVDALVAVVREEAGELPESTPPGLASLIRGCLQKQPEQRFQSAHDVGLCLRLVEEQAPPPPEPAEPPARRGRWGLAVAALVPLAGLLGWWLAKPSPVEPPRIEPLTYTGRDTSPAASPDSRLVAFSSDRDGTPRIWLKQLDGGNESPLTAGPDDRPRFSADGSMVLFVRRQGQRTELYRVSALGGEPRRLTDDALGGDFLPDGRRIAFVRWQNEDSRLLSVIATATIDGGDLREVARLPDRTVLHPRVSPDGRTVAVVESGESTELAVLLIDLADGVVRALTPPLPAGSLSPAVWRDSGTELVYAVGTSPAPRGGGVSRVVEQHLSGQEPPRTLFWQPDLVRSLDLLAGGGLVFESHAPGTRLCEVELESAAAPRCYTRGDSTDRQPVYSPDGEWIAFSSNRSGNLDLWRVSSRSGSLERLTDDPAEDWDPAFLPDGRLLWSSNRSGSFEIWIAGADGTAARQLSNDGVLAENPVASADGQWVVYNSRNPASPGIFRVATADGSTEELVAGVTRLPRLSPDGKRLMYLQPVPSERPTLQVVEIGADGNSSTPIVGIPLAAPGGRARWLDGGRAVAYNAPVVEGRLQVFVLSLEDPAARPRLLLSGTSELSIETFDLSPDGQRIAFATQRREQSSLLLARGGG